MVVQTKHISLDEFMALPDDGNRHEFVRGEVRTMPPPKGTHGLVEIALLSAISTTSTARCASSARLAA